MVIRRQFCVVLNCMTAGALPDDSLPVCAVHWQELDGADQAEICRLIDRRQRNAARVYAGLLSELANREINSRWISDKRTWWKVRWANQEQDGDQYETLVAPWRKALEEIYHAIGGAQTQHGWTPIEVAMAMIRTRTGLDRYEGRLVAAAVDLCEVLGIEPV